MQALRNLFSSQHFYTVWLPPHVMAVAVLLVAHPSFWATVVSFLIFYSLISGLGVAVGFHRYFSHRSFDTTPLWEQAMLYFGCLACHGNPVFWAALHNGLHHVKADTIDDPHSPVAHPLWTAYQGYAFDPLLVKKVRIKAAGSMLRHSEWMWSVNHYKKVLYATWALALLASVVSSSYSVLAGLLLAQVWAIHQEAVVNILGHTSGFGAYRTHVLRDCSVNRNWLALVTWGQALHNNHHANPSRPNFAHDRNEFDPSMLWVDFIRTDIGGQHA